MGDIGKGQVEHRCTSREKIDAEKIVDMHDKGKE